LPRCSDSAFAPSFHVQSPLRAEQFTEVLGGGDLGFAYQPVFDLHDGSLIGFECLLRWQQQDGTVLPARRFIHQVEAAGLSAYLDEWVLGLAATQESQWAERFGPVRLFVNVSPQSLQFEPVLDQLKRGARAAQGPWLELEMTERTEMPDDLSPAFQLLEQLDIGIALDDFGTGYSGLDWLARVPARCVKLDRRFVARLVDSERDRCVARAIVRLASDLSTAVIAEGIEAAKHLEAVRELGCDGGQGYLLGVPMPGWAAASLLAESIH
jgi:EAL domain-containing protein (putative c-di-GMP-specific phosphodiesterase class I)